MIPGCTYLTWSAAPGALTSVPKLTPRRCGAPIQAVSVVVELECDWDDELLHEQLGVEWACAAHAGDLSHLHRDDWDVETIAHFNHPPTT